MGIILPKTEKKGTQDWAEITVNFTTGCSNDCLYCYARSMGIRFGWAKEEDWNTMRVREHDVKKRHPNYGELVMVPSSHDITTENLDAALNVIGSLLQAGNEILIVSKPDPVCIRALCDTFRDFRQQVIFRFTIGAMNNALLSIWEPGAPPFEKRLEALVYAYESGFETSVSIEPMVDAENVENLVAELLPYVTETIWIGKMNYLGRIKIDSEEIAMAVEKVRATQTDELILAIYETFKDEPRIRWKDSIRKVLAI